jgi:hypothetical protein
MTNAQSSVEDASIVVTVPSHFFQVFVYEAMRLFRDKLVSDEDRSQFDSIITRVLESEWSRDSILENLSGIQPCRYL